MALLVGNKATIPTLVTLFPQAELKSPETNRAREATGTRNITIS